MKLYKLLYKKKKKKRDAFIVYNEHNLPFRVYLFLGTALYSLAIVSYLFISYRDKNKPEKILARFDEERAPEILDGADRVGRRLRLPNQSHRIHRFFYVTLSEKRARERVKRNLSLDRAIITIHCSSLSRAHSSRT